MESFKISELEETKKSVVLYAPSGHGKTTALGMLKGKTLIIDIERGTSVLRGSENDITVIRLSNDLTDLGKILDKLEVKNDFDNICIDSLSELEKSMLTVLGRTGKNNSAPELSHYNVVSFKLIDYCRRFRALDSNVIFTGWEQLVEHVNLDGSKYTKAKIMLSGKTSETITGLCDIVGRLEIDDKGDRFINLTASATVTAKDRIDKRKNCKVEELI